MKRSKKPGIAPSLSRILTVREVSEYLRVHRTTIYRLLRLKQIPGFLVGSDWRFDIDAIDHWSRANQAAVSARSEPQPLDASENQTSADAAKGLILPPSRFLAKT
jgi:excisionase family DNA binding protein